MLWFNLVNLYSRLLLSIAICISDGSSSPVVAARTSICALIVSSENTEVADHVAAQKLETRRRLVGLLHDILLIFTFLRLRLVRHTKAASMRGPLLIAPITLWQVWIHPEMVHTVTQAIRVLGLTSLERWLCHATGTPHVVPLNLLFIVFDLLSLVFNLVDDVVADI